MPDFEEVIENDKWQDKIKRWLSAMLSITSSSKPAIHSD
jgi:hypothetical protein